MSRAFEAIAFILLASWVGILPAYGADSYVIIEVHPAHSSYPVGRTFRINESITLPAGMVATLLGEDGKIITISGAQTFVIDDDRSELIQKQSHSDNRYSKIIAKIADLLTLDGERIETLGTTRNAIGQDERGNHHPWAAFLYEDETICARNNQIRLIRKSSDRDVRLVWHTPNGAEKYEVFWPRGQNEVNLSPKQQETAEVRIFESGVPSYQIVLVQAPSEIDLDQPIETLGWMIDVGCESQAVRYARSLASKAERP